MAYKPFYTATTTAGTAYNRFFATSPVADRAVLLRVKAIQSSFTNERIFSDKKASLTHDAFTDSGSEWILPVLSEGSTTVTYSVKDEELPFGRISTTISNAKVKDTFGEIRNWFPEPIVGGADNSRPYLLDKTNCRLSFVPLNGSEVTVFRGFVETVTTRKNEISFKAVDPIKRLATKVNKYEDLFYRGFTVLNRGSGYSVGNALTLHSTTGSSFTATIAEVDSAGAVLDIEVTAEGSGYERGDILEGAVTGSDFFAVVNSTDVDGKVGTIFKDRYHNAFFGRVLNAPGTPIHPVDLSYAFGNRKFNQVEQIYDAGGEMKVSATTVTGGSGTGASIKPVILDGHVTGFSGLPSGSGFSVGDRLVIEQDGFGGHTFLAEVATVSTGSVTGITILNEGYGYQDGDTLAPISGSGTGLSVTVTTAAGAFADVLILDPGKDYVATDSLTITGGGSSAVVTVNAVGPSGNITEIEVTTPGSGYDTDDWYWRRDAGQNETLSREPVVFLARNPFSAGGITADLSVETNASTDILAGNTAGNVLRKIFNFDTADLDLGSFAAYEEAVEASNHQNGLFILSTETYTDPSQPLNLTTQTYNIRYNLNGGGLTTLGIGVTNGDSLQDIVGLINAAADAASAGFQCSFVRQSSGDGLIFRNKVNTASTQLLIDVGATADLFAALSAEGTYTDIDLSGNLNTNSIKATGEADAGFSVISNSPQTNFSVLDSFTSQNSILYGLDAQLNQFFVALASDVNPGFEITDAKLESPDFDFSMSRHAKLDATYYWNENALVQTADELIGAATERAILLGQEYRDSITIENAVLTNVPTEENSLVFELFYLFPDATAANSYTAFTDDFWKNDLHVLKRKVLLLQRQSLLNPLLGNGDPSSRTYKSITWDITRSIYDAQQIIL